LETPGTFKQVAQHWKISDRTVRRWRDLQKKTGSLEPGRFSPGRPRKLSAIQLFLLGFFKLLFPGTPFPFPFFEHSLINIFWFLDALLSQCCAFLQYFGANIEISDTYIVSRGLQALGFTKKKLSHINIRRDPVQRQQWWTLPSPHGVFNVSRDRLVDIDESGIVLYSAERGFGHSPRGRRAVTLSPSPRGTKFTLILAISKNGVIAWDISKNNTSSKKFRDYLHFCLHPALETRGTFFFSFVSFKSNVH
jgi:transposase